MGASPVWPTRRAPERSCASRQDKQDAGRTTYSGQHACRHAAASTLVPSQDHSSHTRHQVPCLSHSRLHSTSQGAGIWQVGASDARLYSKQGRQRSAQIALQAKTNCSHEPDATLLLCAIPDHARVHPCLQRCWFATVRIRSTVLTSSVREYNGWMDVDRWMDGWMDLALMSTKGAPKGRAMSLPWWEGK